MSLYQLNPRFANFHNHDPLHTPLHITGQLTKHNRGGLQIM